MPHPSLVHRILAAALTAHLLSALGSGQVPLVEESALLTGSQPDATFGWGIAADGGRFVSGADLAENGRGVVYVFELGTGGWQETARLLADPGEVGEHLGTSVAIRGPMLVAGAPDRGGYSAGGVYTFLRDAAGWHQTALLEGTTNFTDYGGDVDVDGDRLVVGTSRGHEAFVYVRAGGGWELEAHLTGPFLSYFGMSVDLEGSTLAIGARRDGYNDGAVYVFVREAGAWLQQAKLVLQDPPSFAQFGHDVALSGDVIVASSQESSAAGVDTGAAYIFERTGSEWSQVARLEALMPEQFGNFGWQVAIDGEDLAIAHRRDDTFGQDAGSVYWYQRSGGEWNLRAILGASQANESYGLGRALAIDDGTIFASAFSPGPHGGVFVYDLTRGSVEPYCFATPNSTGEAAEAGALGHLSVAGNDLTLVASRCPPRQPALFIYGPRADQVPFGDGYLCLRRSPITPIYVYPVGRTDPAGDVSRQLDLEDLPAGGEILPGSTWHFQLLYRDPQAGASTFNFSNGLRMTFCP